VNAPHACSSVVLEEQAIDPKEEFWNQVYDARRDYFESTIGPLPGDILKMLNMTGVWPGGGFFVIPAEKVGPDIWV
jgi:hypothetical protein